MSKAKGLKSFFSYYGGKWRIAPKYPAPRYDTIVEPFAGSAGYSLRYPDRDVILVEKYEVLYGIWSYLIRVSEEEILALPDVPAGGKISDIQGICQEARWLMGFCINQATSTPRQTNSRQHSGWGGNPESAQWWNASRRQRIASQLHAIRHWTVIHGSYEDIDPFDATWFVDPPYQLQGNHYKEKSIDYEHLGEWCRSCTGQVIVCEGQDADWLPFEHFMDAQKVQNKNHKNKKSPEMIWTND